jgi:hypothetical protein
MRTKSWRAPVVVLAGVAVATACASTLDITGGGDATDAGAEAAAADASADAPLDGAVDGAADASADAAPVKCDPTQAFGVPAPIAELNEALPIGEHSPRLTADELTIVFRRGLQLFISTRASRAVPFAPAMRIDSVTAAPGTGFDADPMLSADGSRLFFMSTRNGGADLFEAARIPSTPTFQTPVPIGKLNSFDQEYYPFHSPNGGGLWFVRADDDLDANAEIFVAKELAGNVFEEGGTRVTELSSYRDDTAPTLSADGRTIYFATGRSGGGGVDIWVARRGAASGAFGTPAAVNELKPKKLQAPGWLSLDECRLYFDSGNDSDDHDLYMASKPLPP